MIRKMYKTILEQKARQRNDELYRNLIRHEAKIGGTLFGPVPKGHVREFFCLDEHTWVWHEQFRDQQGQMKHKTIYYNIRPDGVLKSQNGHYKPIGEQEAKHLHQAISMYRDRVNQEMYSVSSSRG